jgi:hypothetical protein
MFTTPCKIEVYSGGLDETANLPEIIATWKGNSNWTEKNKKAYSEKDMSTQMLDTIIVQADPAPGVSVIEGGAVCVNGRRMVIHSSKRYRNPDGSIITTEIYLM